VERGVEDQPNKREEVDIVVVERKVFDGTNTR